MDASPNAGTPLTAFTPSAMGTAATSGATPTPAVSATRAQPGPSAPARKTPPPLSLLAVGVSQRNGFRGKGATTDLKPALSRLPDQRGTGDAMHIDVPQSPTELPNSDQDPLLLKDILPSVLALKHMLAEGAKGGPYALWEKPQGEQDSMLDYKEEQEQDATSRGSNAEARSGTGSGWAMGATDDDAMAYAADEAVLSNLRARVPTQLNKDVVAKRRELEDMYARARAAIRALPPQPVRTLTDAKQYDDTVWGDASEETTAREARELTSALRKYEDALRRAAGRIAEHGPRHAKEEESTTHAVGIS